MDESDRNAFSKVMQLLAATYDKEATMDLIEAYWGALRDLPLADIQQAAQTARMRMEWMPRPAHLRKLAGDVEPDHRAAIAWQAVRKALSQHGTYSSVNFDDPVINATIRNLGGWTELGQKDEKDFDVWTRKEFERIYQALYTAGVTEEAAAHLIGITEHENSGRYEVAPPVQVNSNLPPPKVRMLTTKKKPGGLTAGEIVAKAFELAEKSEESA